MHMDHALLHAGAVTHSDSDCGSSQDEIEDLEDDE